MHFVKCNDLEPVVCRFDNEWSWLFLGVEHDIVDVTDGLELQKVFDQSNRGQIPTEATLSSAEEKDLLVSGRVTGVEDSSSNAEDGKSKSDVVSESTDYSTKVFESVSDDVQSGKLSNNKERLTPENDRGSRNLHDIRLNRNYELKGRLNIDSDGLADQNQATRDSVAKVDKIKLAEPAKVGEAAQLESLNAGTPFTAVPASNSSSMRPQPYILKVKNTPARAELDDIYFLCEYFPAIFYHAEIKLFPLSTFSTGASFS